MVVNRAVNQEVVPLPLRENHVPGRPYLTTGEAGARLGQSSFWVSQRIKRGSLEGYGIRREQRIKWFVFADAVAAIERAEGADKRPSAADALPELHDVVVEFAHVARNFHSAVLDDRQASDRMCAIARAALDGWSGGEDRVAALDLRTQLIEQYEIRDEARGRVERLALQLNELARGAEMLT